MFSVGEGKTVTVPDWASVGGGGQRKKKYYENVTRKFVNSTRISHEYITRIFITGEGNANGKYLSIATHGPPPKKREERKTPDKAEIKKKMYETAILQVVFNSILTPCIQYCLIIYL
jgi:hypothetical protein